MKVFEINTVCGSGSTGRISADLARMLMKKGDQCCVAFSRGTAPTDIDTCLFGDNMEIAWHGIMTRITDRHGMYSKKATRELIRKIKEYNPDMIHLHNIHGYYLNIEILFRFLKEYKKPVVWTLHDCWTYTGHCAYYSSIECNRWQSYCHDCPLKRNYPGTLLLDNSKKNFETKKALFQAIPKLHLITPSTWLKEEVSKSFFGQVPCTAIPNGIDLEQFQYKESKIKEQLSIPEDKKIILGVANTWTKQKGLEDFIKLSDMLDESYQLVVVGVSREQKEQLPKRILAMERTQNLEELVALYSAAEIYFNSSIEETQGMTTGEAICCGTPVIVYNRTAIPESVGSGCGAVVEAGDLQEVVRKIEEISHDRESYRKACQSYRERFAIEEAHERYYEIYQKMLEA